MNKMSNRVIEFLKKNWEWVGIMVLLLANIAVMIWIVSLPGYHWETRSEQPEDAFAKVNNPNAIKMLVKKASHGQVHLVQARPGPDGLTEMIVEVDHHKAVAWATPDYNELIYGRVYNRKGKDLTERVAHQWNDQHSTSALTRAIESTSRPGNAGNGSAGAAGHGETGHTTAGQPKSGQGK